MRRALAASVALGAVLLVAGPSWAASPAGTSRTALVLHDGVRLYATPSTAARVITVLVQQSQVAVLGSSGTWRRVRIWNAVVGWVPRGDVAFRRPWTTVSTFHAPPVTYTVRASAFQPVRIPAVVPVRAARYALPDGSRNGTVAAGKLVVTAWQQDAHGTIWYRVQGGWIPGRAARLTTPDPAHVAVSGKPLWQAVSGKGMWLTVGSVADSDPRAVVDAARRAGITHLYLESAISPLGFHGRTVVGPLIDEAHRRGLAVVAWVYPYLYDIAADVALTRQVAAFRTASGGRFDGIAADLERNMTVPAIGAYSQLVRAYVGSRYLLVGVTYPVQSLATYPFGEVARTYNVVSPMDYWHQTRTATGLDYGHMRYGTAYARRYATDSVVAVRRVAADARVAPIGQVFDNFGHKGMGPNAPSGAELRGFLRGSSDAGAIGVSFFQWMTATNDEWREIAQYRY